MPDEPYAYITWRCSECGSEPVEERTEEYDLRCETCGHAFRVKDQYRAEYVPDPEEDWHEVSDVD
jgi:DNA-directed RNA polymerase subunit RPC12/RpoP